MSGVPRTKHIEIDDPIVEGFHVMVEAARRHCRPGIDSDNQCFAYHRLWPYRRRVTALTGAFNHAEYFVAQFRQLAQDGHSDRILISGNADYGLLSQVLHAFRAEGAEPEVTVLDICEAPLAINRWYAQRQGARISTVRSDIVDFTSEKAFSAITTDNFLARIAPAHRAQLLPKWHSLLIQGGKVITTEVTLNEGVEPRVHHDQAHIDNRVARFLERIDDGDLNDLGETRETIAQYVRDYLTAKSTYALSSVDEIRRLFEDNGFRIDELSPAVGRQKRPEHYRRHRRYNVVATRIG